MSHEFLRGKPKGSRAERTEAVTLGDAHDSTPGKGGASISPLSQADRCQAQRGDGQGPRISLPPHPASLDPWGFSPQSSYREDRFAMATSHSDAGLASPPHPAWATTAPS